jgi:hypothetical protein
MIALFILIYLVSLAIHLVVCYKGNKRHIFYVRDLLDEIDFYMWFPVINTVTLIVCALCIGIIAIWKVSKLDVLWEKFRNIELK